jgi:hypothetical protein
MGLRAPRKKFEKCFPKEIPRYVSRGECTKRCSKRTDPGRCVSRRGVVIRSSVKEVPKCLLREFPKIVLVEASNAALAKKGVLRGSFANAVSKVFIECVPKTES